jgi:hypothetical protein
MIVSIHQPNFFPYSGVISKIRASDVFVIFTSAQYSKGNFHNRFSIGEKWFTMSVNHRIEPLLMKQYSDPVEDWLKIKRRLPPDLAAIFDSFSQLVDSSLAKMNSAIIRAICDILDIKTQIVFDDPHLTYSNSTDRLIRICRDNHATTYLSGPSGSKYLDFGLFEKADIDVKIHRPDCNKSALELIKEHTDGRTAV